MAAPANPAKPDWLEWRLTVDDDKKIDNAIQDLQSTGNRTRHDQTVCSRGLLLVLYRFGLNAPYDGPFRS